MHFTNSSISLLFFCHLVIIRHFCLVPSLPALPPPSRSLPSLLFPLVGCVQAACSSQLQRASSCDALLAATAAAAAGGCEETEEDGAGMELAQLLDRIRAQCHRSRLPGPGERRVGSGLGHAAAAAPVAASREHGAARREVGRHLCMVTLGGMGMGGLVYLFVFCLFV